MSVFIRLGMFVCIDVHIYVFVTLQLCSILCNCSEKTH